MSFITDTIKNYIILALAILTISLSCTIWWLNDTINDRDSSITTLTAESKLGEIQQDALRKAILDQSEAVEKQRIGAVKKLETFKSAQYTINAKYERARVRVSDLNGSSECDAIREIIRSAL